MHVLGSTPGRARKMDLIRTTRRVVSASVAMFLHRKRKAQIEQGQCEICNGVDKNAIFSSSRCSRESRCADSGFSVVAARVYGVDHTSRGTRGHRNPAWTSVLHSKKAREKTNEFTQLLCTITQIILNTTLRPAHFPARSGAVHKVVAMAKVLKRWIPILTVCAQVLYTKK